MPIFIDATKVAKMIGFNSAQHFLMNRSRLGREEEFPLPMPTCKRPLKWRGSEVEAWVICQGTAEDASPKIPQPVPQKGTNSMLERAATP